MYSEQNKLFQLSVTINLNALLHLPLTFDIKIKNSFGKSQILSTVLCTTPSLVSDYDTLISNYISTEIWKIINETH
jgi:hypothetical protein